MSYCFTSFSESSAASIPADGPYGRCLPDLPPAAFISRPPWLPACCLTVINGRQFQGSLPWWSAGAVPWQSVSDCRVINCGDREKAISMQRCFPHHRSIQGPDVATQVIIHSLSEPLYHGGSSLWRSGENILFSFSFKPISYTLIKLCSLPICYQNQKRVYF